MSNVTGYSAINWRGIADQMWDGKTIQEACDELGIRYVEMRFDITPEIKNFLLDTSMLASAREEILCQLN